MGFNSGFKGLSLTRATQYAYTILEHNTLHELQFKVYLS